MSRVSWVTYHHDVAEGSSLLDNDFAGEILAKVRIDPLGSHSCFGSGGLVLIVESLSYAQAGTKRGVVVVHGVVVKSGLRSSRPRTNPNFFPARFPPLSPSP